MATAIARVGAAVLTFALLAPPANADAPAIGEIFIPSELMIDPIFATSRPAAPLPEPSPALDTSSPRAIESLLDERVRAGRHWRLETARGAVHVWVPDGYDAATAATIVFVHGYWIDVDDAWAGYRLAQQFALSGRNAMFIAAEAPAAKWESLAWPSLGDLVRTVTEHVEVAMPTRRLAVVGHSGAYRTIAAWLAHPALDTVILLDALYADDGFLPWLRGSSTRRLINIVYETGRFSEYLHRRLPSTLRVDGLPVDRLPDARILYVRTTVGHWQLVTDGVALPLALRAIAVPAVAGAPLELPLGLAPRITEDTCVE